MAENNTKRISEEEMIQSERRAEKLEQINNELSDENSEMAKILAEIAKKNQKVYE